MLNQSTPQDPAALLLGEWQALLLLDWVSAAVAILTAWCTFAVIKALTKPLPYGVWRVPYKATASLPSALQRPLLGNMADMLTHNKDGQGPFAYYRDSLEDAGSRKAIGFYCGPLPAVVTPFAEDVAAVLHASGEGTNHFEKGAMYRIVLQITGEGLITSLNDDIHRAQRREVSNAFGPMPVKEMCNTTVRSHTSQLITTLRKQLASPEKESNAQVKGGRAWTDVFGTVQAVAIRIIAEAAFHADVEEDVNLIMVEFAKMLRWGYTPLRYVRVLAPFFFFSNQIVLASRRLLVNVVLRIIATLKAKKTKAPVASDRPEDEVEDDEAASVKGKLLIDYLIESPTLTEKQIIDHAFAFFLGGSETTAVTVAWTLYLLATHPKVQEELYEELCPLVPLFGVSGSIDDIKGCTLLANVIRESLRLYPPLPVVSRDVTIETVLPASRLYVAAGTHIQIPIFAYQRLRSVWGEDADAFRPSRWEDDPTLFERMDGKYFLPFSVGPRNCIGKDLAWYELCMMVAGLVRSFKYSWIEGSKHPQLLFGPTAKPATDFRLGVTPRTN